MIKKFTLLLFSFLLFSQTHFAQGFLSVEHLGSKTAGDLTLQFFFATTFNNGVDYYRVTYETVDLDGNDIILQGLLVIPDDLTKVYPLACYQHGTSGSNTDTPSFLNQEADIAIAMGGKGYVTVVSDYLGLGIHEGVHPFVHAESEAWVGADMLRAAREYASSNQIYLNDQVFLTGYSQGGHAAMALHQLLEEELSNEFTVTASSPMSGPYSIAEVMRDLIISGDEYGWPGYLINTFVSFQEVYGDLYGSIEEAYKEPYRQMVTEFTNDELSLTELNDDMSALLQTNEGAVIPLKVMEEDFIDAVINDPDHPVNSAMKENNVYDWAPLAPTRLYHCESDDQVPFENSIVAYGAMVSNGAFDVQTESLSSTVNHGFCALPAVIATADFFEQYQIIEDAPVSSSREVLAGHLDIFPNPTAEVVFIRDFPATGELRIFDMNGSLKMVQQVAQGSNRVEVDHLTDGFYVMEIVSEGMIFSEKLLVE